MCNAVKDLGLQKQTGEEENGTAFALLNHKIMYSGNTRNS